MLLFVVHPESTGLKVDNTFPLQVVAVIPARFASSRFPGKPLADLDGRPMIEHVYRRVAAVHVLDHRTAVEVGERSEEHTSELQSRLHIVCRILPEKK